MKKERVSYMMLFCALMLVRNSKATLEQSLKIVPLVGKAKSLAEELANQLPFPGQHGVQLTRAAPDGVAFASLQGFGG